MVYRAICDKASTLIRTIHDEFDGAHSFFDSSPSQFTPVVLR